MKIKKETIKIEIEPEELILKEAKRAGKGAHIYVPLRYAGRKMIVIEAPDDMQG